MSKSCQRVSVPACDWLVLHIHCPVFSVNPREYMVLDVPRGNNLPPLTTGNLELMDKNECRGLQFSCVQIGRVPEDVNTRTDTVKLISIRVPPVPETSQRCPT